MNAKQANRAARRAAEREQKKPKFLRGTKEEKMKKLLQNGITPEMLEQEFNDGYAAGSRDGVEHTFKMIYAAVMLGAYDTYGFGRKRAVRLLKRVDEIVSQALSSHDAIEDVYLRFGVKLDFDSVFDRVQDADDPSKKEVS